MLLLLSREFVESLEEIDNMDVYATLCCLVLAIVDSFFFVSFRRVGDIVCREMSAVWLIC